MRTQYNATVKSWRLHRGKEYSPGQMGALAAKLGQVLEMTALYLLEQERRLDKSIGIIISRDRTVPIDSNITKLSWLELLRTQLKITNCTATSVLDGETPVQAFNRQMMGIDELPDLSHEDIRLRDLCLNIC